MIRPSFQFYPGDWTGNSNLRRCTHQEKGVWIDVMCLLHDQAEYGILRWPLEQIAQAVACSTKTLHTLIEKGVLKGHDVHLGPELAFIYTPRSGRRNGAPVPLVPAQAGPIWYSSRMVRDEYVRTVRGESNRFGEAGGGGFGESPKRAPKRSPTGAPKPPFGHGSSSSSSSSIKYIENSVCVEGGEQSLTSHTHTPQNFREEAVRLRPDIPDIDPVYADFRAHYGDAGATLNRWGKWLERERQRGAQASPSGPALDPDSRGAIEASAIALGIGRWDELAEPFQAYKARVRAAQWGAAAPTASRGQ